MNHPGGRELRVRDLPALLVHLARHPIDLLREPVLLTWQALFTLQVGAAVLSSAAVAAMEKNALNLLVGIFVFPVLMVMIVAVFTLLIYYYFALFTATYLDIRRLHALIVLATLPYFLLHGFSGFLPPLDLIGFAVFALLCVVGLVDQFGLPRRLVFGFFTAAAAIFAIIWSAVQFVISGD